MSITKMFQNTLSYDKNVFLERRTVTKTRAKLVAKQRMGLPSMSKVKLDVPIRSRVLKPRTSVT